MAQRIFQHRPEYAAPPGYVLEDHIEALGLTPDEFAVRHSLPADLITDVIAGNAEIDVTLAALFGRELGLDSDFWLRMEDQYRRELAQQEAAKLAEASASWAKSFPLREMVKRGVLEKPFSAGDAVLKMLDFFGADSVENWQRRDDTAKVAYRYSPTFSSNEFNLAVWLRLGELEARWQQCAPYNEEKFTATLSEIRSLTREPTRAALDQAFALCNRAGVALALVQPFPKVAVSGATRWLPDNRPLIQLSGRYKTNDHLWFTLFHEAAHVLLHDKTQILIDTLGDQIAGIDAEADRWASDFLIPRSDWDDFTRAGYFTEWPVRQFAYAQAIAPAIVVSRLQRERLIPWSRLNHLKAKMQWREPES